MEAAEDDDIRFRGFLTGTARGRFVSRETEAVNEGESVSISLRFFLGELGGSERGEEKGGEDIERASTGVGDKFEDVDAAWVC